MLKWIVRGVLALVALAIVVVGGALGYREFRQAQNERLLKIETPNGIQEAGFVTIGGVQQWVQIRGEDRANPVILLVHGGPGSSTIFSLYEALRPWERDYTIVEWDQRGAGWTGLRAPGPPGVDIQRYVDDGVEVTNYVRQRLGKDKVILLGWSWGSVLGLGMAQTHPELYYAYVGTGQVVDMQRNEAIGFARLRERVARGGDQGELRRLDAIGPPPYADIPELMKERYILMAHPPLLERGSFWGNIQIALEAPGFSLDEVGKIARMGEHPDPLLLDELNAYRAERWGMTYALPMIFILGADDIQTPTELAVPVCARAAGAACGGR
jgi:proline iminopeptidase